MQTLLVVEDNPNQQLLYRMELEDEGYRVLTADSLEKACDAVHREHPDLIVLDLYLKGVSALPDIRKITPGIPIVVNTGYRLLPGESQYDMAEACVTKSSNLNILKRTIARTLEDRGILNRLFKGKSLLQKSSVPVRTSPAAVRVPAYSVS